MNNNISYCPRCESTQFKKLKDGRIECLFCKKIISKDYFLSHKYDFEKTFKLLAVNNKIEETE